jgi:Secretion system C-terminal sorting domain
MKKMNFTNFLKLALVLVAAFIGSLTANAQEKLDIFISNPTDCKVVLNDPDLGGPAAAGTPFVVRKVGLEDPISGAAASFEVTSFTFYKGSNDAGRLGTGGAVGQEYLVTFMSSEGMTSRRIRVYDNLGPVVTGLTNTTIRCTELVNGKAPAPGSIVTVVTGDQTTKTRMAVPAIVSNNPNGITLAAASGVDYTSTSPDWVRFRVNDCHDITFAGYEDGDFVLMNDCPNGDLYQGCLYGTITRYWTFKDRFGNSTTVNQVISIAKPRILFPDVNNPAADPAVYTKVTTTLNDCTKDASSAGLPYADWNCNGTKDAGEEVASGEAVCGRTITAGPATRMNLCAGSYMLTRTWKYANCDGKFYSIEQTVTVYDSKAPTVSLYYRDYARIPQEQVVCMGSMKIVQYVYSTSVDHWQDGYKGHTSTAVKDHPMSIGENAMFPGRKYTDGSDILTIQINPLMSIVNCQNASIDIMVGALDPECSKMTTLQFGTGAYAASAGASNLRLNGMPSMKINDGERVKLTGDFSTAREATTDPFFYLEGVDPCGNITRIKVVVNVIDNITPTTVCEDKDITLTNTGKAVIKGKLLTGGTSDNCTDYFDEALTAAAGHGRILVRRDGSDCWVDNFLVDCQDTTVKVWVRVLDMMNNYSDCCVKVTIKDKSGPTCPMSQPMTAVCTDPKLANLEAFFTQPQAYDNCGVDLLSSTAPTGSLTCGAGTYTKSWTFRDKQGNTTTCNQTLTVTSIQGYRVKPLASELKTCSYTFDKEAERKNALANILLRADRYTKDGATIDATSCSGPVVEVESWEYSSSEYCKIYRIRYTFQDICRKYPTGANTPACYVRLRSSFKDVNGAYTVQAENDYAVLSSSCYRYYGSGTGFDGYYQDDVNGTFGFERFVYVQDKTAPTTVAPVIAPICVVDNTCSWALPLITLTGKDLCADATTTSNVYFTWSVAVRKANGDTLTVTGNTADVKSDDLKALKFGTYTVNYTVQDGCGNISFASFKVTGKDCKSPYINTHDKNTVLAYTNTPGQGMSIINASVIINSLADNCTSESYLRSKVKFVRASDNPSNTYPASAGQEIMFTCSDFKGANPVAVQIWTVDEAGNAVFNIAYVTVEDNTPSACGSYVPQTIVSGGLKTEGSQAAKNVTVSASNAGTLANAIATDANGDFSFNVAQGNNYVVKATKATTEDKYAGVTTFDIARISKHLLDIEKFSSAYQIIASDVDKSGDVDGADMLHIRNFILRKTTTLPGGVWRFIDKSYNFKNAANPFGEDFPEAISLNSSKATEAANFVAVKLGDVNATYSANLVSTVVRSNNALTLNVEDMNLVAGNEYTVNLTADNFNAAAFQGTFNIANATIKSVKAGDLANYNDGNFGIFANAITTSWNGAAAKSANVFAVTFTANKAGKLSEVLTVGSNLTPAVANDAQGTEMNINLKFSTGKVAGAEFALYQNTPNPVASETSIGFNMPKDGAAKLSIYNVEGKVVLNKNIDAKAGLNTVTINKSELSVSGVLYYRLETSEFSATKKMIIIE